MRNQSQQVLSSWPLEAWLAMEAFVGWFHYVMVPAIAANPVHYQYVAFCVLQNGSNNTVYSHEHS